MFDSSTSSSPRERSHVVAPVLRPAQPAILRGEEGGNMSIIDFGLMAPTDVQEAEAGSTSTRSSSTSARSVWSSSPRASSPGWSSADRSRRSSSSSCSGWSSARAGLRRRRPRDRVAGHPASWRRSVSSWSSSPTRSRSTSASCGSNWLLPALALGPGALLTIALIALAAVALLRFDWPMALLIGTILASTDAVLLRDVIRDARLPLAVRHTLSVEAGTNDLIVLPLTLVLATVVAGNGRGWAEWAEFAFGLLVLGTAGRRAGRPRRHPRRRLAAAAAADPARLRVALLARRRLRRLSRPPNCSAAAASSPPSPPG